jgi:hypothetical protein
MAYTQHDLLCKQINDYLNIQSKTNDLIHFHSPNEGKNNVAYRMKQKAVGVRFGVPDFCIVKDALWLEVKTGKDRLNDNQKKFFLEAHGKGQDCFTIRTFNDFLEYYNKYISSMEKYGNI